MNATDRFLKFAAECEQMAKATRDRDSKNTWQQLAQRWIRCAEQRQVRPEPVERPVAEKRRRASAHS